MGKIRFKRTYTVTITEPGSSAQDFSFNNLDERQIFLKEKYAEQRERHSYEEATIKSVTTEDSIAGTIYAELCQIESEDYYSIEDYQSDFYDETDDEGDPALSDEALTTLIEHVSRLNRFFNGMGKGII